MKIFVPLLFSFIQCNAQVYVKSFGAKGDGIKDDAVAINLAVAALKEGDTLNLGSNKTYLVNAPIVIKASCTISGSNVSIIPSDSLMLNGGTCLTIGNLLWSAPVTGLQALKGSVSLRLPDSVHVKKGDLVQMFSKDLLYSFRPELAKFNYTKGQYAVVLKVTGNNITISSPFFDSFNIYKISVYTGIKIKITGVKFDLSKQPDTQIPFAALFIRGTDITVERCGFTGNEYAFFAMEIDGENAVVKNCEIKNFFNIQGFKGGRLGYGIAASCNNITLSKNTIINCKHGITSAARNFVLRGIKITGNTFIEDSLKPVSTIGSINPKHDYAGTIDVHAGVSDSVLITGNTIYAQGRAFFIRNGKAVITGNTIRQSGNPTELIGLEERPVENLLFQNNSVRLYDSSSSIIGNYRSLSNFPDYIKNVAIIKNTIINGNLFFNNHCSFDIDGLRLIRNTVLNGKVITLKGSGIFKNLEIN